ncbi:MAG: hypothetical protein NTV22_12040, partial [bacterium]|nr:hypothetical protein [bacterium]
MKCLLSVMLVFALVDMSYGLVIFPGQVHTNTSSETFDELIVSGVFLLAKSPPTGGGEPRTVTITNGDFVLASGGAIAQDVYTSIATADGVAGADGTGASGGAGSGAGRGGAGGSGTYPGGNGGNGGD